MIFEIYVNDQYIGIGNAITRYEIIANFLKEQHKDFLRVNIEFKLITN